MPQTNPNTLHLFSNVRITRDYSVVHDMDPETWFKYLTNTFANDDPNKTIRTNDTSPPGWLFVGSVSYYRLPETIRIQANYDEIRKATYGCLQNTDGLSTLDNPSFTYLFFWVDAVRLVKQSALVTGMSPDRTSEDVVELDVTMDVWSSNQGRFELYDSHIIRRHKDRWVNLGSLGIKVNTDNFLYEGDKCEVSYYEHPSIVELCPKVTINSKSWELRFMVVCSVGSNGGLGYQLGAWAIDSTGKPVRLYAKHNSNYMLVMNLQDIRNGELTTITGMTMASIQSILAVGFVEKLYNYVTLTHNFGGVDYPCIDVNGDFLAEMNISSFNDGDKVCITTVQDISAMKAVFQKPYTRTIDPDNEGQGMFPEVPATPAITDAQSWNHEPMMYRSPALIHKVVNTFGTEILKVPDIRSLQLKYTIVNIIDINTGYIIIYGGENVRKSNDEGNIGVMDCPSFPITESAWKNYQAIQKAGDDIVYNAKQTQAVVATATGAIGGAAAGAFMTGGNPAGAAVGIAGGIVRGATGYWSNSEELRAKRETIRNSPSLVKSGTGGIGGAFEDYYGFRIVILSADVAAHAKLYKQYFFFGYNVDEYNPGQVNTKTRYSFDYIETRRANIRGEIGADVASEISQIFDRGVRIYHDTAGYVRIGETWNYLTKENWERSLLS